MCKDTIVVATPKKDYAKPQLTTHGNVSELTQHFDDHRDRCGDEGGMRQPPVRSSPRAVLRRRCRNSNDEIRMTNQAEGRMTQ